MIDIKELLKRKEEMNRNIELRCVKADPSSTIELYDKYIKQQQVVQALEQEANKCADDVKKADAEGKKALIEKGKNLKVEITANKEKENALQQEYMALLKVLPNWLDAEVPAGRDDHDNLPIKKFMEPTKFNFKPKDHVALGEDLDLLDFESGTKMTGPKFYFIKNDLVMLQHAIKSFAFKKAREKGFIPLITPDLAKNDVLQGAGFTPRGNESNTYALEEQDLSLIATAEIAVCGMHADDIFPETKLPLYYVAESHCFRREAGTAGRASKGLYRVHQFEKVEMFAFTTPEQSEEAHKKIVEIEESILQELKIPYQVVLICAGDLGAPASKKYDIEAWMPGKGDNGEYGEVTSASNCTDYQARRLNIKYKNTKTGKNEYAYTLNGTASALSRTVLAIMENYQQADGSIKVPDALVPYTGFDVIRKK